MERAAADASRALENQPTEHYRYHTLAALRAITGEGPAYLQVCKRLVARFADSPNPFVNERVVQDCLLLPDSGADLSFMDKLADMALARVGNDPALPYFQACKAMSSYRLGQFREAIEWAEKATKSTKAEPEAKAKA